MHIPLGNTNQVLFKWVLSESSNFLHFNPPYCIHMKKGRNHRGVIKKNAFRRTKLSLAIELHFPVNANKYLFRSPETQGLIESSRFSFTLPNLFLNIYQYVFTNKFYFAKCNKYIVTQW